MVAPPPAPASEQPMQAMGENAFLGVHYKYVREVPTTLVVTVTSQGHGHPVSLAGRPPGWAVIGEQQR